jgi:hypothetical protein
VFRFLFASSVTAMTVLTLWAADAPKDTAAAAKTRAVLLKQKVTVEYADTPMSTIVSDLRDQVKGLRIKLDNKGGVSNNRKLSFKATDKPLDEVLDEMFKKEMLGYVVISNEKDPQYDGGLLFKVGTERGYVAGTEPTKVDDPKTKPPDKPPVTKVDDPKTKPPEGDKEEMLAANTLKLAKLFAQSKPERAVEYCKEVIKKYPNTKAAAEAKELLQKLQK